MTTYGGYTTEELRTIACGVFPDEDGHVALRALPDLLTAAEHPPDGGVREAAKIAAVIMDGILAGRRFGGADRDNLSMATKCLTTALASDAGAGAEGGEGHGNVRR